MDEHYDDPEYAAIIDEAEDLSSKLCDLIVQKNRIQQEIDIINNRAWDLQNKLDNWKEKNND